MAASRAAVCATLLSSCILCLAQSQNSSAPAPAPSLGTDIPIIRIQARVPLPKLPVLEDSYTLNIGVARIMGPGDNTSADDPYVDFTGRVYNHQLVTGLVRVKQGRGRAPSFDAKIFIARCNSRVSCIAMHGKTEPCSWKLGMHRWLTIIRASNACFERVRLERTSAYAANVMRATVCNRLPGQVQTINSSFEYGFKAFPLSVRPTQFLAYGVCWIACCSLSLFRCESACPASNCTAPQCHQSNLQLSYGNTFG